MVSGVLRLVTVLALCSAAAIAQTTDVTVTARTLVPGLGPFTASIGRIGEGADFLRGGGAFEPIVYRDAFETVEDAPNAVVAHPNDVSRYRILRSGALDGATVDVYRVEAGAMRRVRRGRVAEGGFHASGWFGAVHDGRMLPRETTAFDFAFSDTHRPDAPLWLSVVAVSRSGALSEPSAAARIVNDARPGRRADRGEAETVGRPAARGRQDGPPAPVGVGVRAGAGGVFRLSWTPAVDPAVAGWIVMTSETAPETHRGFRLDLEPVAGAPPVRAGDRIVVAKTFTAASRLDLHADRVWGASRETRAFRPGLVSDWSDEDPALVWRLAPHPADTPVPDGGSTYLEATLGPGKAMALSTTVHAGREQDFYPVLAAAPYRFEVWLRADRPFTATLMFEGPYARAIAPTRFQVDRVWRRHEATVVPPRVLDGRRPGALTLRLEGPGRIDVDNLRFLPAGARWLDLSDADYDRLARSGMSALRTHAFVKTGRASYDLAQLTNPPGAASGITGGNTLPQVLSIMARAGVDPWLQIEPHFSPEEWAGLIEYLAAPFDPARDDPAALPWAAKRHAQGRTAPWTDAFDRILFELGNETWNPLMGASVFRPMPDAATGRSLPAGTVYGLATELMAASMRASPFWAPAGLEEKVTFVLGGWRRQPRYGAQAALAAPTAALLGVAGYNGGWDEGEGPAGRTPESYFSILNQVSQVILPSAEALAAETREIADRRGAPLRPGTYEAGPGYAHDGLNGRRVSPDQARAQEEAMKSQAAAVATLDSFLAQAAAGFAVQNFFTFNAGPRWSSHATWERGGGDYAPWRALALFNNFGTGDMLAVSTSGAPTSDLAASRRRQAVADAPQVAAYATRAGDRVTVFLISRRLPGFPDPDDDGFTPMTLSLPFARARNLTLHRMAGPHDAHDVDGQHVAVETLALDVPPLDAPVAVDAALGADARGLPPASALVYVFEGVKEID